MRRTPLQQFGNRIGMYAYLAAIGGLQFWPRIRNLTVEDYQRPEREEPSPAETLAGNVAQEHDPGRESTTVA
jgi:hypothetical protein